MVFFIEGSTYTQARVRTKHMELLDLFFLREKILQNQLHATHVPGSAQCADIMTRAHSPTKFAGDY